MAGKHMNEQGHRELPPQEQQNVGPEVEMEPRLSPSPVVGSPPLLQEEDDAAWPPSTPSDTIGYLSNCDGLVRAEDDAFPRG